MKCFSAKFFCNIQKIT